MSNLEKISTKAAIDGFKADDYKTPRWFWFLLALMLSPAFVKGCQYVEPAPNVSPADQLIIEIKEVE